MKVDAFFRHCFKKHHNIHDYFKILMSRIYFGLPASGAQISSYLGEAQAITTLRRGEESKQGQTDVPPAL